MARTRADVLADIVSLGLSQSEAAEELRQREYEAQRLLEAASEADHAEVLRQAKAILRAERLLYVAPGQEILRFLWDDEFEFEPPSTPETAAEYADAPPVPSSQPKDAPFSRRLRDLVAVALCRFTGRLKPDQAWSRRSPRKTVVVAVATAMSLAAIAAGLIVLSGRGSQPDYVAETLGARTGVLASEQAPELPLPPASRLAVVPAYEALYTLTKKRLDGGKTLYVQIPPVDLTNDVFKEDIKLLIKDIVAEYGAKTSIEIHDERSSLVASYKRFGEKTLITPITDEEQADNALHFIAAFNGSLETGMYLNTLQFFSAANANHATVGKYVEDLDFNPN